MTGTKEGLDHHAFVDLGSTYRLRLTLRDDAEGKPSWVALCRGYGEGESFRSDFTETFTFPASRIQDVRAALEELAQMPSGRSSSRLGSTGW